MEPEGKIAIEQENMITCPRCGSEYVQQIHRSRIVKLITRLKGFICKDCGKRFYCRKSHTSHAKPGMSEEHSERCFNFFRS